MIAAATVGRSVLPGRVIGSDGFTAPCRVRLVGVSEHGQFAYYLGADRLVYSVAVRDGYRSTLFGNVDFFRAYARKNPWVSFPLPVIARDPHSPVVYVRRPDGWWVWGAFPHIAAAHSWLDANGFNAWRVLVRDLTPEDIAGIRRQRPAMPRVGVPA